MSVEEYANEQAGWAFLITLVALSVIAYALGFITCSLL